MQVYICLEVGFNVLRAVRSENCASRQGRSCQVCNDEGAERLHRFLGPQRTVQQLWVSQPPRGDADILEQLLHLRPVSQSLHRCVWEPKHDRSVQPLQRYSAAQQCPSRKAADCKFICGLASVQFTASGSCVKPHCDPPGNLLATALQPSSDSNCSFLSYAWDDDYSCYAAQVRPFTLQLTNYCSCRLQSCPH